jgi:hypothetical protein
MGGHLFDDAKAGIAAARERAQRMRAELFGRKASHYRATFLRDDGKPSLEAELVLGDLRRFTRANGSTFDPNPYQAARLAGRREVFQRIANYLNLNEAEVARLKEVEDEYRPTAE